MQKKKINPWSIVAVLSAIGLCPLFTIAAVLFGIRALVDIKAKGDTRGVRLAWFAILFGSLLTGLYGGGMLWWNINVRDRIEQGPIQAILQGQSGDISSFESMFTKSTSSIDSATFLAALHKNFGTLISGAQDQTAGEIAVDSDKLFLGMVPVEAELEYILQFSKQDDVHLRAKFELFTQVDGGNTFTNRFVWIQIEDKEKGNLVYPASEVDTKHHEK
ncbi:MAG: DUF4190 domain-containing protein [Planctomycetes bacterium]|nr:DUF4190 domain-containing protein [Planctomycetota bacterium]